MMEKQRERERESIRRSIKIFRKNLKRIFFFSVTSTHVKLNGKWQLNRAISFDLLFRHFSTFSLFQLDHKSTRLHINLTVFRVRSGSG